MCDSIHCKASRLCLGGIVCKPEAIGPAITWVKGTLLSDDAPVLSGIIMPG